MGDLADALVISRGGLTKLVDRLVKAGLIERAFCETDRRVSYAVLTPAGRRMHEEMEPVVVGELRGAFRASLSSQEAADLRDALSSLTATSCSG
jgi:DNA-binding MarR family transcriptional regulator